MSDEGVAGEETGFGRAGRWVGLILGPALAFGLQLIPPPEGLSPEAWRVVSLAALMVTWWVSEAIPISATALAALAPPAEPSGLVASTDTSRANARVRVALTT